MTKESWVNSSIPLYFSIPENRLPHLVILIQVILLHLLSGTDAASLN